MDWQAFFRRASAYIGIGKVKDAKNDFAKCAKLAPQDRVAKEKLKVSHCGVFLSFTSLLTCP